MKKMIRIKIDKLVRDLFIIHMQNSQALVVTEKIDHSEFIKHLKNKLLEESLEVCQAKNIDEIKEEFADLLEVTHVLIRELGLSMEQIEKTRMEKKKSRGGFDEHIYCSHVEVSEDNPYLEYFRKNSHKYPEVLK